MANLVQIDLSYEPHPPVQFPASNQPQVVFEVVQLEGEGQLELFLVHYESQFFLQPPSNQEQGPTGWATVLQLDEGDYCPKDPGENLLHNINLPDTTTLTDSLPYLFPSSFLFIFPLIQILITIILLLLS